jgi:hypothetical protein
VRDYKRIVVPLLSTSSSSSTSLKSDAPSKQSTSTGSASLNDNKADVSSSTAVATDLQITDANFRNIFTIACKQTWLLICSDALFLLPHSKHGAVFINYASFMIEHSDTILGHPELVDPLLLIFRDRSLVSSADRDDLMRSIHLFRMCDTAVNSFISHVSYWVPNADADICRVLFHAWFCKLVPELILALQNAHIPAESDMCVAKPLTDIDQCFILYFQLYG